MKELLEYRRSLINRLIEATDEFCSTCLAVKDSFAPRAEGEWNVHQVAAHVRDVDKLVYGLRVRRTAAEQNPEFQNFDGELYMAEHYSADEPLAMILDELRENVNGLANMLRELPDEAWSRESRHATLGHGFTLQAWVERNLAHIEDHMETVKR
jgi:DinB superfamily